MNSNNSLPITIKKVINGGYGLATLPNGKAVLVQNGLPDEDINIQTVEDHKQLSFAKASKIITPHPQRIVAPCQYYDDCGGCNMQHADYRLQCYIKQQILEDLLSRSASKSVNNSARIVAPLLPSARQFGYRQRIRLQVNSRGLIGFNRFRSRDIVPVTRCLLADDSMNDCLITIDQSPLFDSLRTITEEIIIQTDPGDKTICLLLKLNRKPRPADKKATRALADEIGSGTRIFLFGKQFAIEGPFTHDPTPKNNRLRMSLPGIKPLELSWEAGGFCQVNIAQNIHLVQCVLELAAPSCSDTILDLYCGMGNFSLPLALAGKSVLGIESQGSAIRSARGNCLANNITNAQFSKSDVYAATDELVKRGETFDIIVCDPPRQGMDTTSQIVADLCRKRIVYISCDPATLCRDLSHLTSAGFTVKKIQPVDMFPQTHHIETVTLLEKD